MVAIVIGRGNVRILCECGKLENVKGKYIGKMRWINDEDFTSNGYRIMYPGKRETKGRERLILDKDKKKCVLRYWIILLEKWKRIWPS